MTGDFVTPPLTRLALSDSPHLKHKVMWLGNHTLKKELLPLGLKNPNQSGTLYEAGTSYVAQWVWLNSTFQWGNITLKFRLISGCSPLSGEVPAPTTTDPVCINSPNYSVDQLGPEYSFDIGDSCTWMINVGFNILWNFITFCCGSTSLDTWIKLWVMFQEVKAIDNTNQIHILLNTWPKWYCNISDILSLSQCLSVSLSLSLSLSIYIYDIWCACACVSLCASLCHNLTGSNSLSLSLTPNHHASPLLYALLQLKLPKISFLLHIHIL